MALNGRLSVSVKTEKGTQLVLNNIYIVLYRVQVYSYTFLYFLWGFFSQMVSLSHNRKQRRADILTEEDSSSDSIRSGVGLHSSSQWRSSSRQYELPH